MLCQKILGRSWSDAQDITPEQLLEWLEGLPREEAFWAHMAVGALRLAIAQSRSRRVSTSEH
jgi:hypothetical protein